MTLMISFFFLDEEALNPGYLFFLMAILLIVCMIFDSKILRKTQ